MTTEEMAEDMVDKIRELEYVKDACAVSHMSNAGDQDIINFEVEIFIDYEGLLEEEADDDG